MIIKGQPFIGRGSGDPRQTKAKEIQRKILAVVLDLQQYKRVQWLTPKDFRNYDDAPYRDVWAHVAKCEGDYKKIWQTGGNLTEHLHHIGLLADTHLIQVLGIILVEWNIHELVSITLEKLCYESPDESEMKFFQDIQKDWGNMIGSKDGDILLGVSALPDLVEARVTARAEKMIREMAAKVDKRINDIKSKWIA